jgi:hypothetical protein
VGERELEVLGKELLDIGAADVVGLLDLNNAENLKKRSVTNSHTVRLGPWLT